MAAQTVAPTTTAFFILRDDLEEELEEDLEELDLEKEPPLELPPLLP